MSKNISQEEAAWAARLVKQHGSIKEAWRNQDRFSSFDSIRRRYQSAVDRGMAPALRVGDKGASTDKLFPDIKGKVSAPWHDVKKMPLPPEGHVSRYIITSVQNNTYLFEPGWKSLNQLADYYDAQILVGTYNYDVSSYGVHAVKGGHVKKGTQKSPLWYAVPDGEICDEDIELAPGLVWVGKQMHIEATAVNPLSGLQSHFGRKSTIFPHTKLAMESVPTIPGHGTKFMYTTGTMTQRNYIEKKAGFKADFHHCYAGLLVEVDSDGNWFVRQLNADSEGTIYDLDLKATPKEVTHGHRVSAINWGDLHVAEMDPTCRNLAWGSGGILDTLRPSYQFMHDSLDFKTRNGHHTKRTLPHDRLRSWAAGHRSVEEETGSVANLIREASRDFCTNVVVDSNHDRFFDEWLRIEDWRNDIGVNTLYFLDAQRFYVASILKDPEAPVNLLRWAVSRHWKEPNHSTIFLDEDESFVICPDANGGIECGIHGDRGAGGSRGSPTQFKRLGRKVNLGHTHIAGIYDGAYYAGTWSKLKLDYNKGLSAWSHSFIITYENGKRTIVTVWKGKWKA